MPRPKVVSPQLQHRLVISRLCLSYGIVQTEGFRVGVRVNHPRLKWIMYFYRLSPLGGDISTVL